MSKYLDPLSPEEAKTVLSLLAKENRDWASRIDEIAKGLLDNADEDHVANEVYQALIGIDIEDVWDRPSGSTRFRYKEPVEAAYELVEEVLKPFAAQLNKYRKLGMLVQTKKVGLGLAKGIIKFSRESETEFREFAPDDALEWLGGLVMEWETECTDEIEKQCIRDIKKLFHE